MADGQENQEDVQQKKSSSMEETQGQNLDSEHDESSDQRRETEPENRGNGVSGMRANGDGHIRHHDSRERRHEQESRSMRETRPIRDRDPRQRREAQEMQLAWGSSIQNASVYDCYTRDASMITTQEENDRMFAEALSKKFQEEDLASQRPHFGRHQSYVPLADEEDDIATQDENDYDGIFPVDDIDPEYLAALPPDIQEEVLRAQRIRRENTIVPTCQQPLPEPNAIDPTFLEALPEDLRAQVFASLQPHTYVPPPDNYIPPKVLGTELIREQGEPDDASTEEKSYVDPTVLEKLPYNLRQEVYLDYSEESLEALPPRLLAEARMCRDQEMNRQLALQEQRQRVKEFEMQSRSHEIESKLLPLKKRGRGLDLGASGSVTSNGKPQTEPEKKENKHSGLRANKVGRILDYQESDADIRRDVVIRRRSHETDPGPLQQQRYDSGGSEPTRMLNDGSPMQREVTQSNVYPVRRGEKDCPFYLLTGRCGFGRKCRFNHPTHLPQVETTPEVLEENKEKEESLPAEVLDISVSLLIQMLAVQNRGVIQLIKVTNPVIKVTNPVVKKDVPQGTTTSCTYTRLRKHIVVPDETAKVDWRPYFGPVKDQSDHDICWALVAVELVTALRCIKGRECGIVEYSYQELVDFVKPEKGLEHPRFPKHCCYTLNIPTGLTYGMLHGHQKAVDRPWEGCRLLPPPRLLSHTDLGYTGKPKRMDTIEEALVQLQKQPIGAAMPIFVPDYQRIKGGIYRGPTFADSMFAGMHAVSITGAGTTKRGESFVFVRTSHGRKIGREGYLRVSIDVLILRINKGQKHERKYFREPTPLLERFCCPELLTESEENEMKKRMEKEIEKSD